MKCKHTSKCEIYKVKITTSAGSADVMRKKICHTKPEDCAQNIMRATEGIEEGHIPYNLAPGQKSLAEKIIYVIKTPMREAERKILLAGITARIEELKEEISKRETERQKQDARIEYLLRGGSKGKKKGSSEEEPSER